MIDFEQAMQQLSSQDSLMAELIDTYGDISRQPREDHFVSLCRAIVGQQLSVKAAQTIYTRFEAQIGNVTPESLLALEPSVARSLGLSRQKHAYLQDLSRHTLNGLLDEVASIEDPEQLIAHLTQVKGVGRWTAEMFAMFSLQSPDIFAVDDLGLRRAMEALYSIPANSKPDRYEIIAQQWRPWRTVASLYLWKSLHNTLD